jgi:ketosteroid isomerase-like protein
MRLQAAQNAHDIDALVDCFHPDYTSEQPRHPGRAFRGTDQVRRNWTAMFDAFPRLTVELLRHTKAPDGEMVWSEWRWAGTPEGSGLEMLGVIILGIRDDRILWARLYMDEVDRSGATIDDAVGGTTGTD